MVLFIRNTGGCVYTAPISREELNKVAADNGIDVRPDTSGTADCSISEEELIVVLKALNVLKRP